MKKFLYTILIISGLIYLSGRIYKFYHNNFLLDTEAVVNIYPNLPNDKMDEYFGIKKGTYDSNKHTIVYSFGKSDGYLLDYYYNLPVYNYSNLKTVNCNEDFSPDKHYRFSRDEIIDNGSLYVRLINSQYNNSSTSNLSKSIVAVKIVPISFTFGKINSILVNNDGAIRYCD